MPKGKPGDLYKLFKRKNSEFWQAYISIPDKNGNRTQIKKSLRTPDRNEAERRVLQILRELEQQKEIEEGKLIEMDIDTAFGKYYEEVVIDQSGPEDILRRMGHIARRLNGCLLSEIDEAKINNYIQNRKKDISRRTRKPIAPATINRELMILSGAINRAKRLWNVKTNFTRISDLALEIPDVEAVYLPNWATAQKIIDRAAEHLKPIIYTGLYTGLRMGNILKLKWEQIDFKNEIIVLKVKSKKYKGGKTHIAHISSELMVILNDIPRVSEYVFTYKGKPIKSFYTAWKNIFYVRDKDRFIDGKNGKKIQIKGTFKRDENWNYILKDPNLEYINFHILRHTFGTYHYKKTKNPFLTQKAMGHESQKTTRRYVHFDEEDMKEGVKNIYK